ncbi:F-box/LRR-repeat protein 12 isoform X2 [Rhineura floridana]|uniref:F-box/LRR-repeat protein 12 isoform X2 n=1 Tax=Rhineura floridana TaxID=261503 RepID=UPI002AC81B5E|nr:F-box/LRR-repeat protein 12 isoform X2 [Rhineura floridana]
MEGQTLSALPDSLLLQILEWLPPRDRLGGARVCRRWRRLVRDKFLWRHLDLTPYKMSSKALWHLLRNHLRGSLRTLKARGSLHSTRKQEVFTPALMKALGKQCPTLHHLCLMETDLRSLSYDSLPSSLTTLELSCCEISSLWFKVPETSQTHTAFPRIQHLVIRNVPSFSNQHLLNISVQGTLKTLVLSEAYRVTDAGIQAAAPHLGDLEHLALRRCSIGNLVTHFIGPHMKRLRRLDLGGSSSLENIGLPCLTSLVGLEDLCLESCHRLSPEAIVAVCQKLPQLRHLDLSGIEVEDLMIHKIRAGLPSCVVTNAVSAADSSVESAQ